MVNGFDYDPTEMIGFCELCVKGKIHRKSFPTGCAKRSSEPLGLVHSNVCGKLNAKSLGRS